MNDLAVQVMQFYRSKSATPESQHLQPPGIGSQDFPRPPAPMTRTFEAKIFFCPSNPISSIKICRLYL
jgi:hypothetical protein